MMKVSFKVSKRGTRYHNPKPKPNPSLVFVDDAEVDAAPSVNYQLPRVQNDIDFTRKRSVVDLTEDDDDDDDSDEISDADVSFIVNIFPDGYTIDKSYKSNAAYQIASKYDPKLLHPYDRASQSLFAAIECCRVPANFFDDIPCKYKNGKVACEVRDWRKDSSEPGASMNGPSVAAYPSVRRISLKMSVDSIVRDIPEIVKRDWAYGELVEAEAKILLALYPKIDLHPYPNFDRLCKKPKTVKLNLDFRAMRRKRLRQTSVPENSNLGMDDSIPMMDQPSVVNLATQNAGQGPAMDQPNSVNLATYTQNVGQRPTMDQPNVVNLATQNVGQRPTMSQPNVANLATQNVGQRSAMDQPNSVNLATQNVGQRPATDQPNVVNLATQNVSQCNTTVPSPINHAPYTSIPTFPWVSQLPKDQFGVETRGHMQSQAPGTAFNAPRASSTHAMVNLSSSNDGINSFMSAFEGGRGNQHGQSSSMANSDYINRSNPLSFVANQQQKIASDNALRASSSAPGASSTHAMQSSRFFYQDRQSSSMANSNNRNWRDPLALIGNHKQMTLEILDNTPGTAFNSLRASSRRSMSLPSANDGIRSRVSAFDGRTVNQDGQSSFPMTFLDSRSRSNSLVYLGNQQQQRASHMQYNAAQTSVNAPGASSTHGMASLNSNNGLSSIIPFGGNKGNQDGNSSSVANMDNRNWSNPLADAVNQHQLIPLHNKNTSAFSAPGASSTHGMMSLNSNNDGLSSISPFDGKMGNQDGHSSSVANLDNGNQSNPLVNVGYQQPKIEPQMPNQAQRTAFGEPGASSTHTMIDLTSNDDDFSFLVAGLDGNSANQDGQSSFMANADNVNLSNSLTAVVNQQPNIEPHMPDRAQRTAFGVPGASSSHGMMSLSSNDDDFSFLVEGLDAKSGNQDGQSSFMANADNRNQSNPLAAVVNQQPMIEPHVPDRAPRTAFGEPGASSSHAIMDLTSNDDDFSFLVAGSDGNSANQDGQSSFMANADNVNQSNSLAAVVNQQPMIQPHMPYRAQRTAFGVPGASSSHDMMSMTSNDDDFSFLVEGLDAKSGNQDGQSSFMANADNRNQSNSLAAVVNQQPMIEPQMPDRAQRTAFGVPGASSHAMMDLTLNDDDFSFLVADLDAKSGNQDGQSSFMANADNRNQSNPLAAVVNQQPKIDPHMPDRAHQTAFGVPGASSAHGMMSLTSNDDDFSFLVEGLDAKSGNQDGQSSFMANADNRNQSNPLAIVGNHQQQTAASNMQYNASRTAANVPGASSTHAMMDLTSNDDDFSFLVAGLGAKSGNQDGQSSFMANADNRNQSNPLAIVGNQQQIAASNMQYNASRTAANVPGASSAQGTVNLSSDNDADNNQSNPLAFAGYQQQQIAASHMQNQQHGMMSSGSDNDGLWSIVSAFDNKRGHQDGQSSSMANLNKRTRLNPLDFNGNQLQQMGSSHMISSSNNVPDSRWKNTLVQQQSTGGSIQHPNANAPTQKQHRYRMLDAIFNPNIGQQGIRHNIKQEPLQIGRDPNRLHPSFPPQLTRTTFVPAPWNKMSPSPVNSTVKEEHFRSRTSAFSTKPGEFSSGSMGMQFGTAGSSQRAKSVVASAPAIGSTQPLEIITIEDDEPIQIRSSSLPPKSGEFSSGRRGMQIRAAAGSSSHRETSVVNSVPAVGGSRSSSSSTNNSMHLTQMETTLGSKPLPTIPILSGIGSSSSIGNTSGPSVASGAVQKPPLTIPILSGIRSSSSIGNMSGPSVASGAVQKPPLTIPILSRIRSSSSIGTMSGPSVASSAVQKPLPTIPILSGTGPSSSIGNTSSPSIASGAVQKELDRRMRERFNKIGTLAARYKLNCKEVKIDNYKPTINFSSSQLNHALIKNNDNETLKDETCKMLLSMSHAGGNINLCKTRILKFVKGAYIHPGNEPMLVPKSETKLIFSERQSDGTVTMHYCEFDDYDHLAEEDLLPTFPNTHTADMFAAEFCALMTREGYSIKDDDIQTKPISVVQSTDGQHNRAPRPLVSAGIPPVTLDIGTSNFALSSTPNMWMNAEGGGFSVPSPTSPITETLDFLIQSSDAMVLTPHAMSIGQDSNMQQQLDLNPVSNPGSTINAASIMDIEPTIALRRQVVMGLACRDSSNAGGSQSGNLQVPSQSGSGARGRGSRGRAPRGRAPFGQGSGIRRDSNVNPRQRHGMGPPPRMALSEPSVLGESGEPSSNTGVLRIGNVNIDSSLISGSGSGSGSRGLLVRSSGINSANDMNIMQRDVMAAPRVMSDMNLQPASVIPSVSSGAVSSGASRPSQNATYQEGSTSKDWIDDEFIRSLMK